MDEWMNGWMNEWMDGWYWHRTNSFSLKGLHETNHWRKSPEQFYFFKEGQGWEPIHKKYKALKSTRRTCH
jgi:hypothetical protein